MKKAIVILLVVIIALLAVTPAFAAGGPPPGKTIQDACGVSFGQLVGPAKAAGTAFHANYAGGAKALLPLAVAHGCG
jgi:hypothetical protein